MSTSNLKTTVASLGLVIFVFAQLGCEVDMTLAMDEKNPPTFSLGGTGNLMFLSVMEVPPENQKQSIQRSSDENKLLWKIRPSSGEKDKIRALPPITYGVVPPGSAQVFPADGSPTIAVSGR